MKEYHKIKTVYERDPETRYKTLIDGKYAMPAFEYLGECEWLFTEKVDGTNVRVIWKDGAVALGGKTDKAQMHPTLIYRLQELFPVQKFADLYPDTEMCLYGEGYGAKIQKGGGNYKPDGVDFALFDVRIGDVWLERDNVHDIASRLGVDTVPMIDSGTLPEAVRMAREGFQSRWGEFTAEGIVARPRVELMDRMNRRIIAKVKHKDFPELIEENP